MKNKDTNLQDTAPMPILDLDKLENGADINYDEMIKTEEYLMPEPEEENDNRHSRNRFINFLLSINWHIVLLVVLILSVVFIIYRLSTWGTVIDLDELFPDGTETDDMQYAEVLDNILPNLEAEGSAAATDDVTNVLLFGNGPFAEDMDSMDNVGNMIEELSGANIYNCAVPGSYLTATHTTFSADVDPMDAFNFYWLTTLATINNTLPCEEAIKKLGDTLPEEALEAYETITSLDFSTIDVIGIMYDASDYLDGRTLYNVANESDIQTFYGNLTAGVELLQNTYPHIRIIVMSPTYAYAVDENGEYVDSDIYVYDEFTLSFYAQMQDRSTSNAGVSFVDNFYGTVTYYNASDYLIDNIHLNKDGKTKLAERFVYALQYYDEE